MRPTPVPAWHAGPLPSAARPLPRHLRGFPEASAGSLAPAPGAHPARPVPPGLRLPPERLSSAAAASSRHAAASSYCTQPGARSFHPGWERRGREGPGLGQSEAVGGRGRQGGRGGDQVLVWESGGLQQKGDLTLGLAGLARDAGGFSAPAIGGGGQRRERWPLPRAPQCSLPLK